MLEYCEENFKKLIRRNSILTKQVKKYKYDSLTNLKMRKDYDIDVEQRLSLYEFEDKYFGVVVVDIDNLHNLNAREGWDAGDNKIKFVSKYLKKNFTNAEIYRIGGDEFCMVFPSLPIDLDEEKISEECEEITFYKLEVNENFKKHILLCSDSLLKEAHKNIVDLKKIKKNGNGERD